MNQRGGKRAGAGRPLGGGKYGGEPTQVMRVPISRIPDIKVLLAPKPQAQPLPLYTSKVAAGFPSPGEDHVERYLDLNEQLIPHPAATFFVIASGNSMTGAGIQSGDMLIVDRSLEAKHGKIVIAAIDGELTVKRLSITGGRVTLLPENADYEPIDITESQDLVIWGVVIHVIHTPS